MLRLHLLGSLQPRLAIYVWQLLSLIQDPQYLPLGLMMARE